MGQGKWADTPRRLLTVIIGVPLVIAPVIIGRPFSDVLVLVLGALCAVELQRLIDGERRPFVPLVVICGAVGVAVLVGMAWLWAFVLVAALGVGLAVMLISAWNFRTEFSLLVGALYIGVPLAALITIRNTPDGLAWILMLLICNWGTDSFALVGGRMFGRTKLAPNISAGKTIEGAATGFVCGVLAGALVGVGFGLPMGAVLVLNPIIALFTIIGDLVESVFKRHYQVKDTGGLLPGHGGFLDRIDGLILAIVPFYSALVLLGVVV